MKTIKIKKLVRFMRPEGMKKKRAWGVYKNIEVPFSSWIKAKEKKAKQQELKRLLHLDHQMKVGAKIECGV